MATNLAIDDQLLDEALKVGGHRTKKATVTEALEEYTERGHESPQKAPRPTPRASIVCSKRAESGAFIKARTSSW